MRQQAGSSLWKEGFIANYRPQVLFIPNLFIAGSSVFHTGGCANPTLTIVALALWLADHIKVLLN